MMQTLTVALAQMDIALGDPAANLVAVRAYAQEAAARRAGRPTNTATLYAADGALLADYSKIHLFGLMDEDHYLAAGQAAPVFDLPWGRSALAICYDLRFPELFRSYAARGAGVILLPSEWPHPRLEHWRTLARAGDR